MLCVILGDHGLEHLVRDGGQNTFVVIGADVVVDLGQLVLDRAEQDSESDVNGLQILCTR